MPRTARKKSKSGIYHIIVRGNNRQTVFYDDEDREVFLSRIKLGKEKDKFEIYAFCLMSNHIHLLIKEKEVMVGLIMQRILASYLRWYNKKYERVGNLFQDRFKSEPIEDDEYLICGVRYIHQNPLKAGIVKNIEDYSWSSYSAYISKKENLIDRQIVLEIIGEENYKQFMQESEEKKFIEYEGRKNISDEKLMLLINKILKTEKISDLKALSREELLKILNKIYEIGGISMQQISRVTGISMGIVRQIGC